MKKQIVAIRINENSVWLVGIAKDKKEELMLKFKAFIPQKTYI